MRDDKLVYWFSWANILCWAVCFWWMHSISRRQDSMLKELKGQNIRIEKFSKAEHDLIKEVHPQVGEIKQALTQVVDSTHEKKNLKSFLRWLRKRKAA